MRPKFVYFDMGNVILNFDRGHAYRAMADVTGADVEHVRSALEAGGLMEQLERGRIDWPAFHAEFSRRTNTTSGRDDLAFAYSDMFTLSAGMLPVIAGLERSGIRLGILSNTSAVHWSHVQKSGYAILPGCFERLVLSHEIGWLKPEREIFDHATAVADVNPGDIFFCDDLPEHVEAARTAGWDAELFTAPAVLADQLERRGLELGL